MEAHQSSEDTPGFAVVDNKGEAAFHVLDHLISWVRAPVPEGAVGLDHEHGLVAALAQPVLSIEGEEVVQASHEQAVYIIEPTEQPAIPTKIIANAQNYLG